MKADSPEIPSKLLSTLKEKLDPDEHIIWHGQPIPRLLNRSMSSQIVTGIALMLFGALVFYMDDITPVTRKTAENSQGAVACSSVFVILGLGFVMTSITRYEQAFKTLYAITNTRAIVIIQTMHKIESRVIKPRDIRVLEREERLDGSGSIAFPYREFDPGQLKRITREVGFYEIPDVAEVEKKLRLLAGTYWDNK